MATTKRPKMVPNTGNEEVPPGATTKALERDRPNPAEESAAGPRHAAGDPGSAIESYGPGENEPMAEPLPEPEDSLEQGPPYGGPSGGAVGGTPAEGRSTGGNVGGGIAPGGTHRGDSTVGADPDTDDD